MFSQPGEAELRVAIVNTCNLVDNDQFAGFRQIDIADQARVERGVRCGTAVFRDTRQLLA